MPDRAGVASLPTRILDAAYGGIDLRADVLGFGAVEQLIEPRLGGQVEDALRVVGGGFIQP